MPQDAMSLIKDPERIRYACNPYANRMWSGASQNTVGMDGVMPADAFHEGRRAVDAWATKLTSLLKVGLGEETFAVRVKAIPKTDPWDSAVRRPLEYRDIVVRGTVHRCFSNHLGAVLQDTSEPVLSSTAIAYRPRRADAVHEAIMSVASAVGFDGCRYFAKLDVRDAFNSMDRAHVGSALRSLGYPDAFITLVMASVGAPRFRRVQGAWVQQDSERGCPAGLPESSILVNVLFTAFDRMIERKFPGLVYLRYSDDLLLLGRSREQVEQAVKKLLAWVQAKKLQLKGVSPNQSPRSLVCDVQERPLVFLGAEVGQDGNVHIPVKVFEDQLNKIRHVMTLAAGHSDLVVGQSRYTGPGRRARGIETYDWDDVRASIVEFHRYWFALNQGEAEIFLARARVEFNVNPHSDAGPFRKVWVAALGHPDNLIGGGHSADQDPTADPLDSWVRTEIIPLIREALRGAPMGLSVGALLREEELDPSGTSDLGGEEAGDGFLLSKGHQNQEETTSAWDTPTAADPTESSAGRGEQDANELDCSAIGACGLTAAPRGPAASRDSSGATTLGSVQPPDQPSVHDFQVVFVRHSYDPETETTIVTTEEFAGSAGDIRALGSRMMTYEGMPAEYAVLEHVVHRVRAAGGQRVILAMERPWLAKLLLQQGREFRSVGLFQLVRELHALGRNVLVLGPVKFPERDPSADCRNAPNVPPETLEMNGESDASKREPRASSTFRSESC